MKTSKLKKVEKAENFHDFNNDLLRQCGDSGIEILKDGIIVVTRCPNCGEYQKVKLSKKYIKNLFK